MEIAPQSRQRQARGRDTGDDGGIGRPTVDYSVAAFASGLRAGDGRDDGLAAVRSARWSDEYFRGPPVDTDHLNVIGWWGAGEPWHLLETRSQLERRIQALYLSIAEDLARACPL
jgi:hypothetical protein